jgi:hypothetical protein
MPYQSQIPPLQHVPDLSTKPQAQARLQDQFQHHHYSDLKLVLSYLVLTCLILLLIYLYLLCLDLLMLDHHLVEMVLVLRLIVGIDVVLRIQRCVHEVEMIYQ